MSFAEHLEQDARLVILIELQKQADGRLSENILTVALTTSGHRRSREWVRTQLAMLAEIGAVRCDMQGSVMVVEILRRGAEHVERRIRLEGVAAPSRDD